MQQYFVKDSLQKDKRILLDEEQSHHIIHVLRMNQGAMIRIASVQCGVYLARIEIQGKMVCAILEEKLVLSDEKLRITLAPALIKGEKWDYLLQKCCELGAHEIQPFISKRCVIKVKDEKKDRKLQRWNKIALEACEQCKRQSLVEVFDSVQLQELLHTSHQLKIIAYENADHQANSLKDTLNQYPDCQSILCIIGPEGGFEEAEVALFMRHGFQCVSLGPRILRAETAALAMVHAITFYYDC